MNPCFTCKRDVPTFHIVRGQLLNLYGFFTLHLYEWVCCGCIAVWTKRADGK